MLEDIFVHIFWIEKSAMANLVRKREQEEEDMVGVSELKWVYRS